MAVHLVTGGAGFIGSHIAEELLRQGERVRIVDDLSTGKLENIRGLKGDLEFVQGDICGEALMRRAAQGVEVIYHQAAIPSVPRSLDEPLTTNRASVDGTLRVLLAAREAGVRRVVYASSSSVYGEIDELPVTETLPTVPISPYGVAKLAGELYARVFHHCYGMETVVLRYFNVFGPRQDPKSMYAGVTPIFVRELLAGRTCTIFGDGEQTRDFTSVGNIVQANLKAASARESPGKVFNVASGIQTTVNRLYGTISGILGVDAPPRYDEPRPGDIRHSLADITAARELLGYEPAISLQEGLELTVDWLKTQDL
ncbi:MAG: Vi polysaccharide biosynthesis protein VipB/TviC [Planctomycetes bacterium SM23_65]|nr:MAG: Vi polysaccharide biosynthesis protein VipB/TviC [Planctomycetes bacterium SM23_65]